MTRILKLSLFVGMALFAVQLSAEATPISLSGNTSWQQNGNLVTLHVDQVFNSSSNGTSGSIRLQLWATTTRYSGGTINGLILATYQFPKVLGPNQSYADVTQTVAFATPSSGTYYTTLTLEEYTSSGWGIRSYVTYNSTTTWGGGEGGGLTLSGNTSWQQNGNVVTLKVGRVTNSRSGSTGSIRLELWAATTPYTGGTINGFILGTYQFAQVLAPNQYYSDVDQTVPFVTPRDGTYYTTLTLEEYTASGWVIQDYVTYDSTTVWGSNKNTPPFGYIDNPQSGATVSGTIPVYGWTLDAEDSNLSLSFFVDGQLVSSNPTRSARPDVCNAIPGIAHCSSSNPGWTFNWNTQNVANGPHALSLVVRDPQGAEVSLLVNVTVSNASATNTPPFGYLDYPPKGATVSGTVPVFGWGLDAEDSNLIVRLLVDGQLISSSPTRSKRSDVCNAFRAVAHCNSSNPGWGFSWNSQGVANGPHTLSVLVVDPHGAQVSFTSNVTTSNAAVNTPPFGYMDNPPAGSTVSGTVSVYGWALDAEDSNLSISFSVDGQLVSSNPSRSARPDVCNAYPNVSHCSSSNPGWGFSWNTPSVANGAHTLSVVVRDPQGGQASFSRLVTVQGLPATINSIGSGSDFNPSAVAVLGGGFLVVADAAGHRVIKISSTGAITVIAGTGIPGFNGDGLATARQLNSPSGVAVDGAGYIYIADTFNQRIRQVSPSGTMTTIAGTGNLGFSGDGGSPLRAMLNYPTSVAVDAAFRVYFADTLNNRIRRIANGIITTVAGDGSPSVGADGTPAVKGGIYQPRGVAVDTLGNLLFADSGNNCVRRVDSSGLVTTVAGLVVQGYCIGEMGSTGDGAAARSARLADPWGINVDLAGNLYIAEDIGNRVRMVTADGIITTIAGNGNAGFSGDNGPAVSAELHSPRAVASDYFSNAVFIADSLNNRIRKVSFPK